MCMCVVLYDMCFISKIRLDTADCTHHITSSSLLTTATEATGSHRRLCDTMSFSYSIGLLRRSFKRANGLLPFFCKNLCWASLLEIVLSNQFECGKYMAYFPLLRSKALIYSSEREREGQFTFFLSSCGSHLLYADVLGGSGVVAKYRHTRSVKTLCWVRMGLWSLRLCDVKWVKQGCYWEQSRNPQGILLPQLKHHRLVPLTLLLKLRT